MVFKNNPTQSAHSHVLSFSLGKFREFGAKGKCLCGSWGLRKGAAWAARGAASRPVRAATLYTLRAPCSVRKCQVPFAGPAFTKGHSSAGCIVNRLPAIAAAKQRHIHYLLFVARLREPRNFWFAAADPRKPASHPPCERRPVAYPAASTPGASASSSAAPAAAAGPPPPPCPTAPAPPPALRQPIAGSPLPPSLAARQGARRRPAPRPWSPARRGVRAPSAPAPRHAPRAPSAPPRGGRGAAGRFPASRSGRGDTMRTSARCPSRP